MGPRWKSRAMMKRNGRRPKLLTVDELGELVEELCAAKDPVVKEVLTDQTMEGWYGKTIEEIRKSERLGPKAWWLGDPDKFTPEQIHSLLDGATEIFR